MSSSKSKNSDGPKPLISRRLKKRAFRFLILSALLGSGYILYNPNIIEDESLREQVEGIRSEVVDTSEHLYHQASSYLPSEIPVSQIASHLPQGSVLGDEEIQVETVFSNLTQKLKELPQSEVKRLKQDFCADLIYQATTSGEL